MEDRLIPNREARALLKRSGKVAWSRQATRALVMLALLAYLHAYGTHHTTEVRRVIHQILSAEEPSIDLARNLLAGSGMVVVSTSLLALTVGIAASLLQTGALFSFRSVFPRFRGWRRGDAGISTCLLLVLGLGLGVWLFERYLADIFLVLRQPLDKVVDSLGLIASDIGKTLMIVALVFATLAVVVSRVCFLWRYRMTKREMSERSRG
jgi:flagellar biosynthesis protein FlhB